MQTTPEQQRLAAEAARKEGDKNQKPAVSEATIPISKLVLQHGTGTVPNVPSTTTSP
jgi:hypothetical protein